MAQTNDKAPRGTVAKIGHAIEPYVCGGAGAMFASTCVHPIDLTKVRLQLIGQKEGVRPSAVSVLRSVIRDEGFTALYAGLSASLGRQAIYGTARLGLHRSFSDYLKEKQGGGNLKPHLKIASSLTSGAIASFIGNPFDIALVRMQADNMSHAADRRAYKHVGDAVFRIFREEGFSSLFRGIEPNIARAMAMNMGMMATYDQAKEMIQGAVGRKGFDTELGASALAGAACAFTSLPFDLIKTRLQNMSADANGNYPYRHVTDCALKIFKNEGLGSFWRGYFAYWGRCGPHAMIVLLSMESIKRNYRKLFGYEVNQ